MIVHRSCRALITLIALMLCGTAPPALAEGTRIYVQTFDPRAAKIGTIRGGTVRTAPVVVRKTPVKPKRIR